MTKCLGVNGALAIAISGVLWSVVLQATDKPDVLGPYPFTSPKPMSLYFGSSPSQRKIFSLDFTVSTPWHFVQQTHLDEEDGGGIVEATLHYLTNTATAKFQGSPMGNILSVFNLGTHFKKIGICDGYVFLSDASICNKGKDTHLLNLQNCANKGPEHCIFHAIIRNHSTIPTAAKQYTLSLSFTNTEHIIPPELLGMGGARLLVENDTIIQKKGGTFAILVDAAVPSQDETKAVLSVQQIASSVVLSYDETTEVVLWEALSDDVNSEAIAYTVLLIIAFGYWVYVSKPISREDTEGATKLFRDEINRLLLYNLTFSLFMGSVASAAKISAYSHQYTPIETDIILGSWGPQSSSVLPIIACVANGVIWVFISYDLYFYHRELQKTTDVQHTSIRCLFECQLVFNLLLTIPPSAGQAFRISLGFFFGSLLSFIIGRDAHRILHSKMKSDQRVVVYLIAIVPVYVLIVLDLVAPMVWSARMTSAEWAPFVANLWVINVIATGVAFRVFKASLMQENSREQISGMGLSAKL